jgi:hypothetical protein
MHERWTPIYDRMFDPDHELAKNDSACQRWAFMDLCHMAQWRDGQRVAGGNVVKLERGCFLASVRFLAKRWKWPKTRVERFLRALQHPDITKIERVKTGTANGTVYRIVNYDTYANPRDSKRDDLGTILGQRTTSTAGTEEEKKRAKPKKHPIPDDWTPQESHADKAQAERVDLNREAERFRHHHAAKGSTYVDWDRAFHTWLMRAHDFGNHTTTDSKPPPQGAGFY